MPKRSSFRKGFAAALLLLGSLATLGQCGAFSRDTNQMKHHKSESFRLRGKESHDELKEYIKLYQQKHAERQITVHMIAHTHDDVGWLKTVEEYFTGLTNWVQQASVVQTIDTMILELIDDPTKRFTYVEMKFFSMWWREQTDTLKEQVRTLVKEGRLEFVNAGWSMHDEACTHYEDMINNMMIGHQFLMKEFGVKPRIGWHVDPFGHSNANPRLFADMGFDAFFFGRLDFQDKQQRWQDHSMEFIWQPFEKHLGDSVQIYSHAIHKGYCAFDGFNWDDRDYQDDPVISNPQLETFNADFKKDLLLAQLYEMLDIYNGNHLLVPQGCDFYFANARQNFLSLDRLIAYFNSHVSNFTLQYSTPGMFLDAIKQQNIQYPLKKDDMFPYADQPNDYWTGYFTSRANSKGQIRVGQSSLHAANKVLALRVLDQNASDTDIFYALGAQYHMMDVLGVYQHHDAATGTAKQHVADDYSEKMFMAITNFNNPVYTKALQDLVISQKTKVNVTNWLWCTRQNGTYLDCPVSQFPQKDLLIAAHNPATVDQKYIKVKVPHGNYDVKSWDLEKQVFVSISKAKVICFNRTVESGATVTDCDLHIKTTIASHSFALILLTFNNQANLVVPVSQSNSIAGGGETLVYQTYDKEGAQFTMLKDGSGKSYNISFDIRSYYSYQGDGFNYYGSMSGAYIFRPSDYVQDSVRYTKLMDIQTFNAGGFVQEICMTFYENVQNSTAVVRLRYYDEGQGSEWEVFLGGLPNDGIGREVTVNWKAYNFHNNKTFYTDSNGLEMQERILNYRPSFNFFSFEQVSGNFYPINSAIAIVDKTANLQFTVLNDRSQAGSAIKEGRIELMQNRRLFKDDGRGVQDPLNETDQYDNGISVPATYRLLFTELSTDISQQRAVQLKVDDPLQYFFAFNWTSSQTEKDIDVPQDLEDVKKKPLADQNAPDSVKYHFFPVGKNQIQVRVENIGDKFDTDRFNMNQQKTTVMFNLTDLAAKLFAQANPTNGVKLGKVDIKEVSLTGNQLYSDVVGSKTNWRLNTTQMPSAPKRVSAFMIGAEDNGALELNQQRIRFFNLTFSLAGPEPPVPPPEDSSFPVWAIVLIVIAGVGIIGGTAFYFIKKAKASKNGYTEIESKQVDVLEVNGTDRADTNRP